MPHHILLNCKRTRWPQDIVLFLKWKNINTGAMPNYSNVVASKLHIVSSLKEGMVKMSQNPTLFLTMIKCLKFSLENAFFLDFSGNFRVYTYIQISFMYIWRYLHQRVRRIGKENWKSFKGISKTKKETKKHIKRLSYITQFKIEFLLLFNSCRKLLGKMPVI